MQMRLDLPMVASKGAPADYRDRTDRDSAGPFSDALAGLEEQMEAAESVPADGTTGLNRLAAAMPGSSGGNILPGAAIPLHDRQADRPPASADDAGAEIPAGKAAERSAHPDLASLPSGQGGENGATIPHAESARPSAKPQVAGHSPAGINSPASEEFYQGAGEHVPRSQAVDILRAVSVRLRESVQSERSAPPAAAGTGTVADASLPSDSAGEEPSRLNAASVLLQNAARLAERPGNTATDPGSPAAAPETAVESAVPEPDSQAWRPDLEATIERLIENRLMSRSARTAMDLPHPEFGKVTLALFMSGQTQLSFDMPGAPHELRAAVGQAFATASAAAGATETGAERGQPSGDGALAHGHHRGGDSARDGPSRQPRHDHTGTAGERPGGEWIPVPRASGSAPRRGIFA